MARLAPDPAAAPPPGPVPLAAGEVQLSLAPVHAADDPGLDARLLGLLAPEELGRHRGLRTEEARRQHLLTRALVRCALSRHSATAPGEWRFRAGSHGRPELVSSGGLAFSVSNSSGLVACAVARDLEVGLDAEPLASGPIVASLSARVLAPPERDVLAGLSAGAAAEQALSLWTLKEAYAKARGLGLSLEPGLLAFVLRPGEAALAAAPGERAPGRWHFELLDVAGHRVALACAPRPRRITLLWAAPPDEFRPLGQVEPSEVPSWWWPDHGGEALRAASGARP